MQKAFTDVLVRSVAAPPSGRLEIADAKCPGLALRNIATGAKSWCFRFRDPKTGADGRMTIGTYPDIPLADARDWATSLRQAVAAGRNPVEAIRDEREAARTKTFAGLPARRPRFGSVAGRPVRLRCRGTCETRWRELGPGPGSATTAPGQCRQRSGPGFLSQPRPIPRSALPGSIERPARAKRCRSRRTRPSER
jgi:Arm DNA-binding domain